MLNSLSRRIAAGALVTAAALITSMPASAQQAAGSSATPPQAAGQQRPARPELFTPEERDQYRKSMQAAKTPEERAKLRAEMHKATEQRAKEKGITLPQRPMHQSKSKADGSGADAGKQGARPSRQAMDQLFTKEEHEQYRQRMQEAKTPEERAKLRDEMHKTTEQRAKEKGIELPKRPMRGPHSHDKGGPRGAGDAAKKDGSAPAATPKP
jgi:hypothetical protein